MSKKLEEIRKKIDTIDNKVHDLLMERAALVSGVAAEKRKANMQVVQPAREAKMIRRLLERHKGPLPEAAVVSIWRELVGAVSLLQTGLKVVVTATEDDSHCWDQARNYFGSVLPMRKMSSPLTAVGAVREGESSFAVVPWPDDRDETPWWVYVMQEEGDPMRIVCALPYGYPAGEDLSAQKRALVISKIDFNASGDDHSFVALELDPSVSRGRIVDALNALDLEPLSLHTKSSAEQETLSLHLVEIGTFIAADDPRLADIQGAFEESCTRCIALGGYPVPPVFKEIIRPEEVLAAPKKQEKKKKTA